MPSEHAVCWPCGAVADRQIRENIQIRFATSQLIIVEAVCPEIPVLVVGEKATWNGAEFRANCETLFAQIANDFIVM